MGAFQQLLQGRKTAGLRELGSQHRVLQELEPKAGLVCAVQLSVHLMDGFPMQSNLSEVFSQAPFVSFVKNGALLDKLCLMGQRVIQAPCFLCHCPHYRTSQLTAQGLPTGMGA